MTFLFTSLIASKLILIHNLESKYNLTYVLLNCLKFKYSYIDTMYIKCLNIITLFIDIFFLIHRI